MAQAIFVVDSSEQKCFKASDDMLKLKIKLSCVIKTLLLLLKGNSSRQNSKVLYCWGIRRRGETGNNRKVRVKRVVSLSSAFLFQARKHEAVTRVEP